MVVYLKEVYIFVYKQKPLFFLDLRIEGQARRGECKLTDEKKYRKDREKGEQRGGREKTEKEGRCGRGVGDTNRKEGEYLGGRIIW